MKTFAAIVRGVASLPVSILFFFSMLMFLVCVAARFAFEHFADYFEASTDWLCELAIEIEHPE